MMRRLFGGIFRLFVVGLVLVCTQPALAQESQVFEQKNSQKVILEPALQEIVIENEARTDAKITLENTTDVGQRFTLRLVDFGSLDESGGVAFLGTGDPRDYQEATWLEIGVNDIVIAPHSKSTLDVTIKNDENFSPGGHYGAVLFEKAALEGDAPLDKTEVAINQVFSALIYVRKVGGEVYNLTLLDTEHHHSLIFLPESIALRFENQGNVHVTPRGTVRISDPLGTVVKKASINESSGLVLPDSKRLFTERLKSMTLAWLPGLYSVRIEYRYDGKDTFEVVGEKYWHIPPVSIGCVVLLTLCIFFFQKRRKQKPKKSEKEAL